MDKDENKDVPTPSKQLLPPPYLPIITEPAMLEFSAEFAELTNALAKAQAKFGDIPKNRVGKVSGQNAQNQRYEYTYKYADIADILKHCRPICSAEGIAIVQWPTVNGANLTITTMLLHGQQWMRTQLTMRLQDPKRANASQVLGGQVTYMRRYPLCAMLGVQAEEDTDNQTNNHQSQNTRRNKGHGEQEVEKAKDWIKEQAQPVEGGIDSEQQLEIKMALSANGVSMQDLFKYLADELGEPIDRKIQAIPEELFDIALAFINTVAVADEESDL